MFKRISRQNQTIQFNPKSKNHVKILKKVSFNSNIKKMRMIWKRKPNYVFSIKAVTLRQLCLALSAGNKCDMGQRRGKGRKMTNLLFSVFNK